MWWAVGGVGAYAAIGTGFASFLSQTPYSENGFLVNAASWPFYAYAIFRGGL